MDIREYTVSELNRDIKNYLESNDGFSNFYLLGEISGITYHKSGHLYFNVKDKKSVIKCVAFSYKLKRIAEDLKEGEMIKLFGHITVYETGGNYQVLVDGVEKQNKKGKLYEEFEKIKKKLYEKGYFDENAKKRLPYLPSGIGIVTADTGAAVRDIINTAKKRFTNINLYLYPAKVQGEGAVEEIIKGIRVFDSMDEIDVIIIGRGGGSIEDLWCFNSEELAEAVYQCNKPIVSAVGHEIDFVITDFVADIRAATPTQAAEIVVPDKKTIIDKLGVIEKKVLFAVEKIVEKKRKEIKVLESGYTIKGFPSIVNEKRQEIIELETELQKCVGNYIEKMKKDLSYRAERIISLNPLGILKRGYTVTMKDNKIIRNGKELSVGDRITTRFSDGEINSRVE